MEQKIDIPIYDKEELVEGCTVQILTNSITGDVSVGWWHGGIEDEPIIGRPRRHTETGRRDTQSAEPARHSSFPRASLLFILTGSAATVACVLAASGNWMGCAVDVLCCALCYTAGKYLEKDVIR